MSQRLSVVLVVMFINVQGETKVEPWNLCSLTSRRVLGRTKLWIHIH